MKTILVLSPHPELASFLRETLNPESYHIVHRASVEESEPLLTHGLANICCFDVELGGVQETWGIDKIRRRAPHCPILVITGAEQWEWEEEAYLKGALHVLRKPLRPKILNSLLDRLWPATPHEPIRIPAPNLETFKPAEPDPAAGQAPGGSDSNLTLRGFSAILTHSLNTEAMLRQFLLLLRETLGLNRAAIFLLPPRQGHHLSVACSLGLSSGLLENFKLSLTQGIGVSVARLGRILRRNSNEARLDIDIQREFELLGCQVAVPIFDRERLLGVAVLDGRITGEPLCNAELELIFHLLEQLGFAVKNIWLHDQLATNHDLMSRILRELKDACVVVSHDLTVMHSNMAARRFFIVSNTRSGDLEFSDLPQLIGAKVFQVLQTGTAVAPFRYEHSKSSGTIHNITILPFHRNPPAPPASALLLVEDLTRSEQLRQLAGEAANLRLIRTMADRLAHEVGNAMVPVSTHQQLLSEKFSDPEFRASLDVAMSDGVKRVNRLINQMRFLARDGLSSNDVFPLAPLIEEAYEDARRHQPTKQIHFACADQNIPVVVTGDRAALKQALFEVILNALQANPGEPRIGVFLHRDSTSQGPDYLRIEVQDNGAGFTAETAQKGPTPFFTTRTVGLGLGLTVSRKIIETHRGRLDIIPPSNGQSGLVRISLPMEPVERDSN